MTPSNNTVQTLVTICVNSPGPTILEPWLERLFSLPPVVYHIPFRRCSL